MPKLTVEGVGTFQVPNRKTAGQCIGRRRRNRPVAFLWRQRPLHHLPRAIHRRRALAHHQHRRTILAARGLTGAEPGLRSSCQILCDQDMRIEAESRLAGSTKKDVGPRAEDQITPPPVWT